MSSYSAGGGRLRASPNHTTEPAAMDSTSWLTCSWHRRVRNKIPPGWSPSTITVYLRTHVKQSLRSHRARESPRWACKQDGSDPTRCPRPHRTQTGSCRSAPDVQLRWDCWPDLGKHSLESQGVPARLAPGSGVSEHCHRSQHCVCSQRTPCKSQLRGLLAGQPTGNRFTSLCPRVLNCQCG